ncbi:alpha/beta-hydrolase [Thozetella sp. PMI_491]|nr:alpha/beta-hydrolase [Thozetella sp. PMI_491]
MAPGSDIKSYVLRMFGGSPATNDSPPAPTAPKVEPPKCRFPLGNDTSDTVTLPDGRKIGYAQYGAKAGKTIFYMHGLAASRVEAAPYHHDALEVGARIIAVDRPGMGLSSPHPGRKLVDYPKDIDHLATHLGVNEYSGSSGGGPSVLACAFGLPRDKLKSATIVCGLGPPDIGMSGADLPHRVGFPYGFRFTPPSLNRWFWRLDAYGRLELPDEERFEMMKKNGAKAEAAGNKLDAEIFKDDDNIRVMLQCGREAFAQGYDGALQDAKLDCTNFGFRVEDIRKDLPVHLWYGKKDVWVPPIHGKQIAARLGDNAHLHLEDATHLTISFYWRKQILAEIVKTM